MKDNKELFSAIKEIFAALEAAGENKFSQELNESLSISTVPGEILGEIRLRLQEIPHNKLVASQMDQKANSALKYLNMILTQEHRVNS